MCPCTPISLPSPTGPTGPSIPGFGRPFSFKIDPLIFPAGFPEDLLSILDLLNFKLPSGLLKPVLNPNYGKDIFDGIFF